MKKEILYKKFIPKDRNLDKVAADAIKTPEIIQYLLDGVSEKNVRVKFGCFNTLVLISEKEPKLLYPYFDLFAKYLDSDNKIIKLGGINIIANLSRVDDKKKFDKIFNKYYSFISDPSMTAAANVSKGSSTIVKAKPYLKEMVTKQLLKVANTKYKTEECKNILVGHVITSFNKMYTQLENNKQVLDFINKNIDNPWKATKIKAQKFLTKYS